MNDLAEQFVGHELPPPTGHNNPPEPTPYEKARDRINDLHGEAKLWLDGAKVDSQELADGIANLLAELRKASATADAERKIEAKPFDEGKAEVQARYNPILKKAEQAEDACKKANEPWLKKLADEIEAKAKAAREEADRKRREAEEAIRSADPANLAERSAAEDLVQAAKKAETAANKAGRVTAKAGGAHGKSSSLRTKYVPTIADDVKALRWAWGAYPDDMKTCALMLAVREVAAGKLEIPGFTIEKVSSVV